MFGLLNVDKPRGPTSRDVVSRVARIIKPHKAGHAGTLDPLATGVLIVAVGPATRLVEYVQRLPKTYVGAFLLGRSSDTEDIEGQVVELPDASAPRRDDLVRVLPRFEGTIEQRPPAYSAIKVAGKRAYTMSRRGETVELLPRPVVIHSIELLRYEYPEVELRIHCGSGTYVRSLGRDIARALGTEAVMAALRRTAIGPFTAENAVAYDRLDESTVRERLEPPERALSLPVVAIDDTDAARLMRGQPISTASFDLEAAAIDARGRLVAILKRRGERAWPDKCFPDQG